jgi:hypothetical protein
VAASVSGCKVMRLESTFRVSTLRQAHVFMVSINDDFHKFVVPTKHIAGITNHAILDRNFHQNQYHNIAASIQKYPGIAMRGT